MTQFDSSKLHSQKWLYALLIFAFCIRLAAAFVWQAQADSDDALFRFGDSDSYWYLAERLVAGEAYEYKSGGDKIFRAPAYPLLLSTIAWMQPPKLAVMTARTIGCVLGTICVAIIYAITRYLVDSRAAFYAGMAAAIYPGAIGMSIFVLSEAIFCPLMLASLSIQAVVLTEICTENVKRRLSRWLMLATVSGLLGGAAVLARPSWILWIGMLGVYVVLCSAMATRPLKRLIMQRGMALLLGSLIGTILAMSPWWFRNYQAIGYFVPTTTQVGASLYDSLHEGASGASDEGMTFSGDFAKKLAKDRKDRQTGESTDDPEDALPFEVALDRRLKNAAIDWALANPSDVARLSLVKFRRTWTPFPSAEQLGTGLVPLCEAIGYLAIMVMAALALFVQTSNRQSQILFALPCLYFATIHAVFVGSVRYRQPAVLAACVLAGIGTAWIVVKWQARMQQSKMK